MFDIGMGELGLIAVVGLLVLGPERLPRVARTTGALLRKARQSWQGVRADIERELAAEDLQTPGETAAAANPTPDLQRAVEAAAQTAPPPTAPPPSPSGRPKVRAMSNTDGTDEGEEGTEQTFISHLVELRARLLKAVAAVLIVLVALLPFANRLYHFIAEPLLDRLPGDAKMVAIDVASPFFTPLRLTFPPVHRHAGRALPAWRLSRRACTAMKSAYMLLPVPSVVLFLPAAAPPTGSCCRTPARSVSRPARFDDDRHRALPRRRADDVPRLRPVLRDTDCGRHRHLAGLGDHGAADGKPALRDLRRVRRRRDRGSA
jgi:Tat protein translocase TatB subunit